MSDLTWLVGLGSRAWWSKVLALVADESGEMTVYIPSQLLFSDGTLVACIAFSPFDCVGSSLWHAGSL